MKILQNILIGTSIFFVGWIASAICCTAPIDSYKYKRELIEAQYDALEIADSLLLEHRIYSRKYLEAYERVDDLYWETL